jgi:hypothetical protein
MQIQIRGPNSSQCRVHHDFSKLKGFRRQVFHGKNDCRSLLEGKNLCRRKYVYDTFACRPKPTQITVFIIYSMFESKESCRLLVLENLEFGCRLNQRRTFVKASHMKTLQLSAFFDHLPSPLYVLVKRLG